MKFITDAAAAVDILSTAAEVTAGVLAIAMTVVAIVVQLAATRYSHRITFLFIREPLNIAVLGLYLLTTLQCLWMALALSDPQYAGRAPGPGFAIALGMVALSLLSLLPYFAFVLSFISPLSVIERIRRRALRSLASKSPSHTNRAHRKLLAGIDDLHDVARSAIEQSDRSIAMACVSALSDLMLEYRDLRSALPASWSEASAALRDDPDFISLPKSVMESTMPLWVEMKIFRQFLSLTALAVPRSRDVANLVAIRTAQIGSAAARSGAEGDGLVDLCIRCFNSYLRATLNARDLRSAYYVTNQYRLLGEELLRQGREQQTARLVAHFQLYGVLSHQQGLSFLLEVVAHDIAHLIRQAVESGSASKDTMIGSLLEVDQEIKAESEEASLLGVRRAQLQLAAFLLDRGDETAARRICLDLSHEPASRLDLLIEELGADSDPWYHEVTDRGVNFAHLEPALRRHLPQLREWARDAPGSS